MLVFSNGEKIGDGIIKLPLLNEIHRRFPSHRLIWVTNLGPTVYNHELKNIAQKYIYQIIEKVNLKPFFWQNISSEYNFDKEHYDYIFDTQKAVYRSLALKRIKCNHFISATANGIFSTIKNDTKKINRNYYLDDLLNLLDLIKFKERETNFKVSIPIFLEKQLSKLFNNKKKYIGIAPGAGEINKIWPLEKFIAIGKYYEKKNFKIVLYLGPKETKIRKKLINEFPDSIIPEEILDGFSNIEVVMGSTKFLSCAISNDSGISHMLSTNYCPLIKLFGPKESKKFTPDSKLLQTISSSDYNSKDVSVIPVDRVVFEIDNILKHYV